MAIVRPSFDSFSKDIVTWQPGRMVAKVLEITESDKADRFGNNALVFKFEIVKSPHQTLVGKRLSRWFPLGGAGSKSLWRCLKTLNPEYSGREFDTNHYIGKKLEVEIEVAPADKDGKIWPRITRVYPFMEVGEVATTLKGNVMDVVGLVDDFDA